MRQFTRAVGWWLVVLIGFGLWGPTAGPRAHAESSLLLAEIPPSESPSPVRSSAYLGSAPQPGVAISLALLPGVALHGAGSWYAGQPGQAVFLFLAELGGAYLAYRGVADVTAAVDAFNQRADDQFNGQTETVSRGIGLAAGGVMLFLTSWFYDLTASPQAAAIAQTRRPAQPTGPTVTPQITGRGLEVVIDRLF